MTTAPTSLPDAVSADIHLAVHETHDFFSEFLPALFLVAGVFLLFVLISWCFSKVWSYSLWKLGRTHHFRRLTEYLWVIFWLVIGLGAAFGAVGINILHLLIIYGVIGIAFSTGLGDTIANMAAGIMLQTNDLFEEHRTITVNGVSGKIIRMNLLHVEVDPTPEGSDEVMETIQIPNAILTRMPVRVNWKAPRKENPPYSRARPTSRQVELGTVRQNRAGRFTPVVHPEGNSGRPRDEPSRSTIQSRSLDEVIASQLTVSTVPDCGITPSSTTLTRRTGSSSNTTGVVTRTGLIIPHDMMANR